MLDFSRQYEEIRSEVLSTLEEVCLSQKFILGPHVASFEAAAAQACAVPHAIGCASGTDALWLALAAANIGTLTPGVEATPAAQHAVITTPFSFFASVSAILRAGARPLLADIDPATFNLSPTAVEAVLNSPAGANVKAILPVHLYGQCADFDAFNSLKQSHNLVLIEDAAQAFGATWRLASSQISPGGQITHAGALGDAAAFSFYPTKNLSAFGDAGLVTTTSAAIDDHARVLRGHGMRRRYFHEEIGWNSRLDSLQAAILEVKLRHLPRWNQQRRTLATRYDQLFQAAGLAPQAGAPPFPALSDRVGCSPFPPTAPSTQNSSFRPEAAGRSGETRFSTPAASPSTTADGIVLPYTDPRATHVFHQYVIRAPRRDALRQYLTDRKIGSEIYYPLPLHQQESLAFLGYKPGDFPHSERAAAEVLALPMYPELREDEQQTVVEAIRNFYA